MQKSPLGYGCWPSPVSPELVAGKALRFQTVQTLGENLYWTEMRPQENGRTTLMRTQPLARSASPTNQPQAHSDMLEEVLPANFSIRTRVHEYGGSAFLATDSTLFFINADDQQIWSRDNQPVTQTSSAPRQITKTPNWRFADLAHDPLHNRLICIAEIHEESEQHPRNLIVSISLETTTDPQVRVLLDGKDFYASPRLSPNGRHLAFLSWNLPAMPWESAQLQLAELDNRGDVLKISCPNPLHDGASFQPEWDQNGNLWFINDDTGFGQLYRFDGKGLTLFPLTDCELADPLWVLGMKTYGFLPKGQIAARCLRHGEAFIAVIDPASKNHKICPGTQTSKFCMLDQLVTIGDQVGGILSQIDQPNAVALISCKSGETTLIRSSASFQLSPNDISIAETVKFNNRHEQAVYGHYYPPANHAYYGPNDEQPPVILTAHGGPTAYSDAGLMPKVQFWTSRGFGIFSVNYSGSWGFGKAYRRRLDGQWGVLDVTDMIDAARMLIDTDRADPARLLISGSSAGGYTVLQVLTQSDLFAAGASYYGICDLARLNDSTHKFEAGYLQNLLGLTSDNQTRILKERSPLYSSRNISSPVIFFQGLQDKVVPPDQAQMMVEALSENGIPAIHKVFDQEGHGFRQKQTVETALGMEYQFYTDVLNLRP